MHNSGQPGKSAARPLARLFAFSLSAKSLRHVQEAETFVGEGVERVNIALLGGILIVPLLGILVPLPVELISL